MDKITAILAILSFAGLQAEPAGAAAETYFPPSLASAFATCGPWYRRRSTPIISDFENKWFSKHLSAAREPSIFLAAQKRGPTFDAIRFTWLRSFDPPVFVRIEGLQSSSARLVAKELFGKGGYEPGGISKQVTRTLTAPEITQLRSVIQRTRLLSLPPRECGLGLDGAEWLVEIADRNGYHFLNRWSPEHDGVRDIGLALLRLAGWRFKEIY